MLNRIRKFVLKFTENKKDVPVLAAFASGFYPLVYYFSKNFHQKNSLEHLVFFASIFIISSIVVFLLLYYVFNKVERLKPYKKELLFVLIIATVSVLFSEMLYLKIMKKALVVIIALSMVLAIKFGKEYKKLILLLLIMSVFPFVNSLISLYDSVKPLTWQELPDTINEITIKQKPNIYLIQPDGYVSQEVMEQPPYNHKSDLYDWLDNDGFKLYPNFRSNYNATLLSNASMFSMKHHYYGGNTFPAIEMANSRDVVSGKNPVVSILKNNDYHTFLVVQDEYFQQNNCEQLYDYRNIDLNMISMFSKGYNVQRDVFEDLKSAMRIQVEKPKFFFIEKILPHHVYLDVANNKFEEERDWYLNRLEQVNEWLKNVINYISEKDENALIIVLADHGGFVGIENYQELYSNNNPTHLNSTFSVLAAIKWNGYLKNNFDKELRTNVNLFRILFSVLSEDNTYLDHLEDNSVYNLNYENPFYNSVYKAIDDKGNLLLRSASD